jgi:hypothetical protein
MPRVRLLTRMNVADGHHERGDVVDVPGEVASYLSQVGRVEIVRGEQPETPEHSGRRTEKARRREVT